MLRNQAKYGVYAFSSSSDYNVAAVFIGSAKQRVDEEYARSVKAGANLNVWTRELMPQQQDENHFEYSLRAKQVALAWARENSTSVAREWLRGLSRRWLSPGDTRYNLALFGIDARSLPLTLVLAAFRLLFAASLTLGVLWSVSRGGTFQRRFAAFFAMLFAICYLSSGPVTDARFFLPDATLAVPLAAAGYVVLKARLQRFRERSVAL